MEKYNINMRFENEDAKNDFINTMNILKGKLNLRNMANVVKELVKMYERDLKYIYNNNKF